VQEVCDIHMLWKREHILINLLHWLEGAVEEPDEGKRHKYEKHSKYKHFHHSLGGDDHLV
jgi:hypothetical protein